MAGNASGFQFQVKDKKAAQAALIQLQNALNEVDRLGRVRHVDVSDARASIQRDIETVTDLIKQYGAPTPIK